MSTESDIEATIVALEDDRQRAMLARDVDRLGELLADDLVYVHTTGLHDTKHSYLQKVKDAFVTYKYLERLEEHVTVVGEAAYVTGRHIGLTILQGEPRLIDSDYVAIWKVVAGSWQFCVWHSTVALKS